jgi:alkyl hydroperoxide reductase subunit AhpC
MTKSIFCVSVSISSIFFFSPRFFFFFFFFSFSFFPCPSPCNNSFEVDSTVGKIKFHEWAGDKWVALFSHPADFTPVCTTELGAIAKLETQFTERNVKLIGLSVDSVDDHKKWVADIEETQGAKVNYPLIADKERNISVAYSMLDVNSATNKDAKGMPFTVRSFFIIDPAKKVRFIATYPASAGRNFFEFLRVIDSLQLTDKHKLATPANWKPGDDAVAVPSLSTPEAEAIFGAPNVTAIKPYLRLVKAAGVKQ